MLFGENIIYSFLTFSIHERSKMSAQKKRELKEKRLGHQMMNEQLLK